MTMKGEALINLSSKTTIAKEIVETKGAEFSGWAGSILLEQPLVRNHILLPGSEGNIPIFSGKHGPYLKPSTGAYFTLKL